MLLPERESSYQIDVENAAEMARLTKQARMLSEALGLLPEAVDMTRASLVLDIGCGPGAWVLEMAQRYPASLFQGIDISERMTAYARYSAQEHQISNAQFQVMDARQPLAFADASVDVVHARFITGFLSVTTWPQVLSECFRVLRPGGVICNTEFESLGISTSMALTGYNRLIVQAARRVGQCFAPDGDQYGITAVQHRLLRNAGFQRIQPQAHSINYSQGMPTHQAMFENFSALMKLLQPFMVRQGVTMQEEAEELYARAITEMEAETFCAIVFLQRIWGEKALEAC
ncbi:MAG TPA: methyltransferase domain-containing protein [Ktedonobacteraceae bacterium]